MMAFTGRGEDWLILILMLGVWVVVPLLLVRWVVASVKRSIKARQDLARGIADIADRLERIESKLGETQSPKR